jgi:putative endonuclease
MDVTATVYILRCKDGSYYTGITERPVEARVWEHNHQVADGYTSRRTPVELVWCESFARIIDAIVMERRIKGWSRAKKEALIARDYERLRVLAKNRQGSAGDPRGSTGSP